MCLNWNTCFSMRFLFLCFFILNKLFEQCGWTRTDCEIARNGIICNRTTFKKHKICQSIRINCCIIYCVLCSNWKTRFSIRFHFLFYFILNKLFEQCGWNRTACEIARNGIICNETTFEKHKIIQKYLNKLRYYCALCQSKNPF